MIGNGGRLAGDDARLFEHVVVNCMRRSDLSGVGGGGLLTHFGTARLQRNDLNAALARIFQETRR